MGKVLFPTCCFCGSEIKGFGNNPAPLRQSGRCCDSCNLQYVTLARYLLLQSKSSGEDEKQIIKMVKDKMKADFTAAKERESAMISFATSPDQPE